MRRACHLEFLESCEPFDPVFHALHSYDNHVDRAASETRLHHLDATISMEFRKHGTLRLGHTIRGVEGEDRESLSSYQGNNIKWLIVIIMT